MAKFIEVTPIKYGKEQPRILINTEKINYVQELEGGVTSIHLSDVPLDYFGRKDLFPKSLHVATPYEIVWDDIMKAKEADDGND